MKNKTFKVKFSLPELILLDELIKHEYSKDQYFCDGMILLELVRKIRTILKNFK